MSNHVFGFEQWEEWLKEKARSLREAGQKSELRSGGAPTPKPCCSFLIETDRAGGQLAVWITGEMDFDVMDAQTKEFVHNVWGMIVDDLSFESAFDDFLTRVMCHPTPGQKVPASMRSAGFSEKISL